MVRCATLSRKYRALHGDHLEETRVKQLYMVQAYIHGIENLPVTGLDAELKSGKYVTSNCPETLRQFYRKPLNAFRKDKEFLVFLYKTTVRGEQSDTRILNRAKAQNLHHDQMFCRSARPWPGIQTVPITRWRVVLGQNRAVNCAAT